MNTLTMIAIHAFALQVSLTPCPECDRSELKERTRYGLEYIARETNLDAAFLWSYYIAETGGSSKALVQGYNLGGIQPSGKTAYYETLWHGISAWVAVFNSGWFDKCKCLKGEERQRCFYERYYHRSPKKWHGRWKLEQQYEDFFFSKNNKLEQI